MVVLTTTTNIKHLLDNLMYMFYFNFFLYLKLPQGIIQNMNHEFVITLIFNRYSRIYIE